MCMYIYIYIYIYIHVCSHGGGLLPEAPRGPTLRGARYKPALPPAPRKAVCIKYIAHKCKILVLVQLCTSTVQS